MNNAQQTARVGLFFLLGLALVWVTFETLSGGGIFRKAGYTLTARFDDLVQLKSGDDVRMAGVKIGQVAATRLVGRRAEAVLQIDPKIRIPRDSVAEIQMSGVIGTNYLGIIPGVETAQALPDGGQLETRETPSMNKIMSQLSDLGQKLSDTLGSVGTALNGTEGKPGLIQRLDAIVADNSEKIGATMSNLREITDKLNHGQGTLGKLLNDPQLHDEALATVNELKASVADARELIASAKAAMDQARSGQSAIGVLLYDRETAANLKATVANIHDVTDKIARGEGTLGKLLTDDTLYNSAKVSLKKADRALDSLNDSGPISAVGILANSLF